MAIDLTKFYKIAIGIFLFLLMGTILSIACGGESPNPVDDEVVAVEPLEVAGSFADILAGQELTTELQARLDTLVTENTAILSQFSGQIQSDELTPDEADQEYNTWLTETAAAEGLTQEQLERLLLGAIGGRY
ncbi:hypothetical protein K8R78_03820 [bacterium]|nr:hypothetical protein [bacterium]